MGVNVPEGLLNIGVSFTLLFGPILGSPYRPLSRMSPGCVISLNVMSPVCAFSRPQQAHEDDRGIAIQTSPTRHSHGSTNGGEVDRGSPTPLVETPICPVSAKKMVDVTVSQNSVARAARGWDDDPPVAPLGMRHFPHKNCSVATLVGGRVFSDRAATKNKVEHEVGFSLWLVSPAGAMPPHCGSRSNLEHRPLCSQCSFLLVLGLRLWLAVCFMASTTAVRWLASPALLAFTFAWRGTALEYLFSAVDANGRHELRHAPSAHRTF